MKLNWQCYEELISEKLLKEQKKIDESTKNRNAQNKFKEIPKLISKLIFYINFKNSFFKFIFKFIF